MVKNTGLTIADLENEFGRWDLGPIAEYAKRMSTVDPSGAILQPYVPFVGPKYADSRLLIYATAQNLPRNDALVARYRTASQRAVRRLYLGFSDADEKQGGDLGYSRIAIEPHSTGVIPALAGMFFLAQDSRQLTLEQVHQRIAVTNYYKFSFQADGTHKDLGPEDIDGAEVYWQLNDNLVARELHVLQPKQIITFSGRCTERLRAAARITGMKVHAVNDPAWIIRGGSGLLGPGGSRRKASDMEGEPAALECANSYSRQVTGRYQSRTEEVRSYLLHYYRLWKSGPEIAAT